MLPKSMIQTGSGTQNQERLHIMQPNFSQRKWQAASFTTKTAAHEKLPFGTKVKVTNIRNGKSVIVKINDRGPFVKGRIIDLSMSAFSSIAKLETGIIDVKIEVVK